MVTTGAITAEQARAAAAKWRFRRAAARHRMVRRLGGRAGAGAHTSECRHHVAHTLDARLQAIAEARLTAMLDGPGAAAGVTQGAVVALDAATGAVHAMVGGRDYRQSPFNRAVLARRQPGSAFKPFTWLAALEKGVRPDDTVLDAPIRIGNWSPADFERRYLGEITVEEALAQSINTVAVRLLLRAGGPRVAGKAASRLGIGGKLPNDASLALGTGEVGLLELAAAYAAFFNGGKAARRSASTRCRPRRSRRSIPSGRDDGADGHSGGDTRYRAAGRGAGPCRRRQDRNDAGLPRCLVHRLYRGRDDRGLARQRRQRADERYRAADCRPDCSTTSRSADKPSLRLHVEPTRFRQWVPVQR